MGHAAVKENITKYPAGRRKLETAGIIVFSSLMAALSLQLIIESLKSIFVRSNHAEFDMLAVACNINIDIKSFYTIGVVTAIVVKSIAFVYCWQLRQYPTANIFAIDHRNDIVLNVFGLTLSSLGAKVVWWLDPAVCYHEFKN